MRWTPEYRIEMARKIASVLVEESGGIIMSRRTNELGNLILHALSMPESFLNGIADRFAEFA